MRRSVVHMDTMTLMHMQAARRARASRHNLTRVAAHLPTAPHFALQQPVQPASQTDDALTKLVDLGLRSVVPVQYQIVKTGGEVLESPSVPGVVKLLVGFVVGAAVVSAGNEIGRTIDNLLS
jgi:hypothetical protein